jgi:hypothetical protein
MRFRTLLCAVALAATVAPAARGQTIYVVGNATQFGTIDLSTNTYTQVAASTPNQLDGLTTSGGTLYGATISGQLYTVNPATGAQTAVGSATAGVAYTGLAPNGAGSLFTYDVVAEQLGSIDRTTGAYSAIGASGFNQSNMTGTLAVSGGTLYGSAFDGNVPFRRTLVTFNTSTGAASFVGSDNPIYQDLILFTVNGALQGLNGTTLYSVNSSSGALTQLGTITGANLPVMFSAAVLTPVPEPAASLGVVMAAAGLTWWCRRRGGAGVR